MHGDGVVMEQLWDGCGGLKNVSLQSRAFGLPYDQADILVLELMLQVIDVAGS